VHVLVLRGYALPPFLKLFLVFQSLTTQPSDPHTPTTASKARPLGACPSREGVSTRLHNPPVNCQHVLTLVQ
jgi:hypothetical protein